jgi:hypothetical protein
LLLTGGTKSAHIFSDLADFASVLAVTAGTDPAPSQIGVGLAEIAFKTQLRPSTVNVIFMAPKAPNI